MSKELRNLFETSKHYSIKWEKYFEIYDDIFSKFRGKKITFVEIGILNGGSLKIWREYFGPDARVIGIDLNPECKQFEGNGVEIVIGNQSDPIFWDEFFKKYGKVDIILDDGGHTNLDQITTTIKSIENINNDGILLIEDTSTSYISEYNSNPKYSFINFCKKTVDDLNYTFPFEKKKKFNFSLNKYIYSIQFYESIVVFKVNRNRTRTNKIITNKGINSGIRDFFMKGNEIYLEKYQSIFNKISFVRLTKFKKKLKNFLNTNKIKNYFN
tara:strand:- start:501 stop:1310 length:810 start_codon:yes stop_codon:yes gene_type:complete